MHAGRGQKTASLFANQGWNQERAILLFLQDLRMLGRIGTQGKVEYTWMLEG